MSRKVQDQSVGRDEELELDRAGVDWRCLSMHCSAIETKTESLCCREYQWCQILLEEVAESADMCNITSKLCAPSGQSGAGDIFRVKVHWNKSFYLGKPLHIFFLTKTWDIGVGFSSLWIWTTVSVFFCSQKAATSKITTCFHYVGDQSSTDTDLSL